MGATPMDPTDDELQLKAHVTSTLTDRGVLGKIKAQLRAAVFDVMHEQGELKRHPNAPQLEAFAQEESFMALEIVMDFLAFFQFEHALQVLQSEASRPAPEADRFAASVRAKLGLATGGKTQRPVLLHVLERLLQSEDDKPDARDTSDSVRAKDTASPVAVESHYGCDAKQTALSNSTGDRRQEEDDDWKPSGRRQELVAPPYSATEDDDQAHRETANMEESMAEEEILSGSEIEESVAEEEQSASVNYSQDYSTSDFTLPEKDPVAVEAQRQNTDKDRDEEDQSEEEDESVKRPPPVPSKLSAFDAERENEQMLPPPVTSTTTAGAHFDDEDSDEDGEAARLNALDAKLKAMEAEDESGVLQQLKASLQAELQQQDDHEDSKAGEEHDPYGSDFEEEEVVSEISEEVESVADLSDQEDESAAHDDDKPISQLAVPPPSVVLTDKLVEGKDALNSYDYIEDVERD